MANFRLWFVHRKWNVLSKLVVPRVQLSMRYITSELEEIEREDNFRLKRFKELKYKNKKGDDNADKRCYCKKQQEKGDDFVCFVCKQNEERKQKKGPCEAAVELRIEVIGDKASSFSTVNQKRLDDLNAQLEKVISLTCQCKLDGLVSQSVDKLIYVCEELRNKLETDQKQTDEEQASQSCCNSCKDEVHVTASQQAPPKISKEQEKKQEEKEDDTLGYFETKFKETVKVMKFKNEDGTISEERQVVTVKSEKKHPHKPNEFGISPCCKVKQIASITSDESRSDSCDAKSQRPTKSKSEEISCCMNKGQTKVRTCISDSGSREQNEPPKVKSKKSSLFKCLKVCDAATDPKPPPPVCCPKKSPSKSSSNKTFFSINIDKDPSKTTKQEPAKKDVACEHKTEVKTVCCDAMWKDVATSSTGLAESSEEVEELSICIKGPDDAEPAVEVDKESIGKKSKNITIKISQDKESDEAEKKKSSQICSICSQCSQSLKDTSTTTSNIILETKSLKDKPSSKQHSCVSSSPETKKSSSKIDKPPKPCCKDTKTDVKPKAGCKIRIISNQLGSKEKKVQEFIFFGNILDAIKQILVPNKSDENAMETCESKEENGVKTSKKKCSLLKKSSSVCKSCKSTKIPSKSVEKSQSCPQCTGKNVEKSISWCRPRSKSTENVAKKTPKPCSCAPRPAPLCPVCNSEMSKDIKSTTSAKLEDDECLSCEIESCQLSKNTVSSATDINDESVVCPSCEDQTIQTESKCTTCDNASNQNNKQMEPPKPKCKICYSEEDPCKCPKGQNQEPPKASESKCEVCNRSKAQCECYPKPSPKPKCKICFSDDNTSKSTQTGTQGDTKKLDTLASGSCPLCSKDQKSKENKKTDSCKICFSDDNTSKSTQTGTQGDTKKLDTLASGSCPLCSKDQKSKENKKTDSIDTKQSKSLCCDPSRMKNEMDCKKCTPGGMKDASTSTRRSDRYDVRPLNLMKPVKKMTCTCYSDSNVTKRSPQRTKKCSSWHGDYYK